jgi:hypothetical protein
VVAGGGERQRAIDELADPPMMQHQASGQTPQTIFVSSAWARFIISTSGHARRRNVAASSRDKSLLAVAASSTA